jgi:hypothetical protein
MRMKVLPLLLCGLLGLGFGVGAAGSASALSCSVGKSSFSLGDASAASCFEGNDTNQVDSAFSMFERTGWSLASKTDGPDGSGALKFVSAPLTDTKAGTWSLPSSATNVLTVVTLKAGNAFAAFLLEPGVLSGTWSASKDLSHSSIYTVPGGGPAPVPLPAGLPLILVGTGALVLLRRRTARA